MVSYTYRIASFRGSLADIRGVVPGEEPYTYYPFGAGPHICLGNHFAMLEGQLILATVAQRYRMQLVPGFAVEARSMGILRPRHGLSVILHAR